MKIFFRKYLDNNCTEEEFHSFVELFVKPGNKNVLEENMKEDWRTMSEDGLVPDLSGVQHKIHYEINKQEQAPLKSRKLIPYITRIAAILLIPLAIAYLFQIQTNNNNNGLQTISTPLASKTTFELPDGSTVWLNSGSSISFPKTFNGDTRLVKLKGEAYFDVKKSNQPFKVETSQFTVNVLGTAFNVMAYDDEIPSVTLERGKVLLETISNNQEMLQPGQQAVIDTVKQSITLNDVDTNLFSSWIKNQLILKNEPLGTVVKRLERWYNIEIEITDKTLLDKEMTANIKFESIREVMDLMELTLPLKYEYNKNSRKLSITKD